jgi:hypothetical protein
VATPIGSSRLSGYQHGNGFFRNIVTAFDFTHKVVLLGTRNSRDVSVARRFRRHNAEMNFSNL